MASCSAGESAQAPAQAPPVATARLRMQIEELLVKYDVTYMPFDAPDLALFEELTREAKASGRFIEELILLTRIRTQPSGGHRPTPPLAMCPAGRSLISLRKSAEPAIKAALVAGNLSEWQKVVLQTITASWQLRDFADANPTKIAPPGLGNPPYVYRSMDLETPMPAQGRFDRRMLPWAEKPLSGLSAKPVIKTPPPYATIAWTVGILVLFLGTYWLYRVARRTDRPM